jgi:hypothetical protein
MYLEAPLEPVENVVAWWGVSYHFYLTVFLADSSSQQHSTQYPVLARIARDYLAIQGSSVPSERAFSGGGLTGTRLRARLSPQVFEALQILKSAYRNGHIGAAEQAEAYYNAMMEALEVLDYDSDDEE